MTMNMIMNITISITITITIIIVFIIITINIIEAEEYKKLLDLESLRDIIQELQDTKLKLIVQIDELKEQIKTQRADHTDVYFYLNKKCDDAFETIESLGNNNNIKNMIIIIIIIIYYYYYYYYYYY